MKLETPTIPVEHSGTTDQGEFSIKNSAAAFAILSSGLYSNKYEAILRELGCNAYDSHVEAGFADKPFTVHLPTRLNPIFSVRDYGVGLNHEEVMGLYTTYFATTKNDSNDFVGCMGLGSKSPFSYTKNFTITAVKDGVKGQYSAFIGDKGIPNIIQLTTEATDEGNGVEVAFAVEDRSDMQQFQHEAKKVYKWFQTRPEFTGNSIEIPELKYAEMNIIPGVHMSEHQNWANESYAIMGNVAYPIKVPDGEELPDGVRNILHENSFVIRFDIGDLDIAASREELGYTPRTIKSLSRKAEKIIDAMEIYVINKIKPAKSKWDRNLLASDLINNNEKLFGPIVQAYLIKHPAQFVKGTKKLYSRLDIIVPETELMKAVDGIKFSYKNVRKNYSDYKKTHLSNIQTMRQDKPNRRKAKKSTSGYTLTNADKWNVYGVDANKTLIIFNDESGNVLQRIRVGFSDPDYKDLFKGKTELFIFQARNKKADKAAILKYIKTRFGNPPILLASKLPEMALAGTDVSNVRISVQRFITKNNTSRWNSTEYTFDTIYKKLKDIEPTIEKNKKKTFLYLKLSHKGIIKPFKNDSSPLWNATAMYEFLVGSNIAEITGINLNRIYGVNKTSLKTITQDKRWVNFFDYIEKEFNNIDWKSARSATERKIIGQQFNDSEYEMYKVSDIDRKKFAKHNTPIGVMFRKWEEWKNNVPAKRKKGVDIEYDMLIRVMQQFFPNKDFTKTEAKLDVTSIEKEYHNIFEEVEKAYPLLQHLDLDSYDSQRVWKDAIEYIKLVDKAR